MLIRKHTTLVPHMDLFMETARRFELRTQLHLGHILDRIFHRDQRIAAGARKLSGVVLFCRYARQYFL